MNRILTALTSDIDDMEEAYRIRRLALIAVACVLAALIGMLAPWPSVSIPAPECHYDTDAAGQLWHTPACDNPAP